MGTPSSHERRIGDRQPVGRVEIGWRVPTKPRRQWFGSKRTIIGHVVDVSVTGLAIEAPISDDLYQGQIVRIGFEGMYGDVVIRRAEPTDDPTIARYGVEMRTMDSELRDTLHRLLEATRPRGLEQRWQPSV